VVEGRVVKFRLLGDASFTYTVTASGTPGTYDFSGIIRNEDQAEAGVTGDSRITVTEVDTGGPAPTHSATRSFSVASVPANGEVEVTITAMGYGQLGQVEETLPAGFSYVDGSSSLAASAVVVEVQTVKFRLLGDASFTYTVTASGTPGTYDFSGIIRNEDQAEAGVTGDSRITVTEVDTGGPAPTHSATRSFSVASVPANGEVEVTITAMGYGQLGQVEETVTVETHRATRSFSDASVEPGDQVVVTITATGYGQLGQVEETLPAGFSYVDGSSSLAASAVVVEGRVVKFRLLGENIGFAYTVTASSTVAHHNFVGVLRDEDRNETPVGGARRVTVGTPPRPTPRPTVAPTPTPTQQAPTRRRSSSGGGGGSGIAALPAGTVAAGATVSSPAPSETVPAQARVRTPNAGVVRITVAPEQATPLLQGFNAAGTVFDITAPRASAEEPLVLTFLVRTQTAAGDLIVLKDGVAAADCRGASGQASPDPCVSSRGKAGTTVVVKVLTSEDGIWEFRSSTLAAAPTPAPTVVAPTPKPTVAPTMRPTPEPTVAPTPEPTVAPTMRPTPTPTAAVVLPRPRPTATPTAVPTAVPPAPTAASTPAPTATPTTAPMAVTVAPEPTPTAMPEPTVTTAPVAPPAVEEDEGFPLWLIVVIIVGVGAVLVGGGFIILRARGG
jgi:hypothetical protein